MPVEPFFLILHQLLKVEEKNDTAVGGSRAGGSKANFGIFRKIMSEALRPI